MRAVYARWAYAGHIWQSKMPEWCHIQAALNLAEEGRVAVRMDNGQLCTFRRLSKSPPQGGEG